MPDPKKKTQAPEDHEADLIELITRVSVDAFTRMVSVSDLPPREARELLAAFREVKK